MLKATVGLALENNLAPAFAFAEVNRITSVFKHASFETDSGEGPHTPKPEDFIYIPFRFISATIVGGYSWKATDFSDAKVLKKSVGMLKNKIVYLDHATYTVQKNVGIIVDAFWSEGYTAADGTIVPAGIDGVIRIDAVKNSGIARDLKSDPPTIQSCSVTVVYNYEPSHTFKKQNGEEDPWQFEYKVGTTITNISTGKEEMIRRICVEVEDYLELSLVTLGADPFAKIKTGEAGELLNVDKTAIVSNSRSEGGAEPGDNWFGVYKTNKIYFANFSLEKETAIHLKQFSSTESEETMFDKEFKISLGTFLGVDPEKITKETLLQFAVIKKEDHAQLNTQLSTARQELTTATGELDRVKGELTKKDSDLLLAQGEVTELKKNVTELEGFKKYKEESLAGLRVQILEASTKKNMGKKSEAFEKLLAKADETELKEMAAEYSVSLGEMFGHAFCKTCKSDTGITYQKSEEQTKNLEKPKKGHIGTAFA